MAERRFALRGEIDLAAAGEVRSKLLVLVNATNDDLVLDCADLSFIDSQGIKVLVETQRLLAIDGRGFRMVNVEGMTRRSISVLGLSELLGIEETQPAV